MNREGLREKVVSASLAVAWGLGMVCTNHIAKVSLSKAAACLWNLHASGIGVYCSLTGGIPGGARGKESACQCRTSKKCGFDPWVRKIPWRRNGNALQYSFLEKPMDRGAWWATVHGSQRVRHD